MKKTIKGSGRKELTIALRNAYANLTKKSDTIWNCGKRDAEKGALYPGGLTKGEPDNTIKQGVFVEKHVGFNAVNDAFQSNGDLGGLTGVLSAEPEVIVADAIPQGV